MEYIKKIIKRQVSSDETKYLRMFGVDLDDGSLGELEILNHNNFEYINSLRKKYGFSLEKCRVLEIGIGSGYLAKEFIFACKPREYLGLDFDNFVKFNLPECFHFTKLNLNSISQINAFIEKSDKFDLIFVFDVLEHIVYFNYLLNQLHRILTKTGGVVIGLPVDINLSAKIKLLFGSDFFNPFKGVHRHINFFSLKDIFSGFNNIEQLRLKDVKNCGLGYGLYDKKYHLDKLTLLFPALVSRVCFYLVKK